MLLLKDLEVNRLGDLSRNWAQAVFRGSGWGWKGWMAVQIWWISASKHEISVGISVGSFGFLIFRCLEISGFQRLEMIDQIISGGWVANLASASLKHCIVGGSQV